MFTPTVYASPGSDNAISVMILGSGELGKELAIAFQRLGVEVHAVDSYPGAPALQVALTAHVIDMTDPQQLRLLVEDVRPTFIVPEIEALATDELVRIEQDGLATVVPTARATKLTMDREGIRRLAAEQLGLPTSPYRFAADKVAFDRAVAEIGFPCVVKPVMSSSGKGQSVVRDAGDIDGAWNYAQKGGRAGAGAVIVEGFVDFDYEITLLTVRSIDPATGKPATWFCEPIGHRQEMGDYVESWQPMAMSESALESARSIAARITGALGGRGIFGVELFVKGDEVFFSEVSPRPHDTGMVTMASQRLSEFDLHARAILGLPVDVTLISPGASAVIHAGQENYDPLFTGVDKAMAVPESTLRLFGKPDCTPRRRMGVALATAETTDQARQRAVQAASCVVPAQ
ncbi:formate-dependent phosphoribosylglycinamide formyltransferase [Corynebacterium sp. CCM 8862]|uniref:Formate-dependent phosphoribosylglycinamide formyltransferase n=1 Tax=Corynebacterium mendelii TaxID=2765362 RepID=A0A939E4B6_9CORY|nr:formate-dependent phosphoribosylglycinamide formyltransferase [Corynebacterium mendelii]MBN9645167.1 formate-dependent phosphoribosylglycinamide formyltransferase [Corynebacterium mendelii]